MNKLNLGMIKKDLYFLYCYFFFPLGLYALWKNNYLPKYLKIILTSIVILFLIFSINTEQPKPIFDLKEQKKDNLRNIAFSSERFLIENLKDPSSYELIDRDYRFLNDSIYEINITYSATNSFGGRIQQKYLKTGILKFNPKDTSFVNIVKFEN